MNNRDTNHDGRGGGPLLLVMRGVAAGIGFASEGIKHQKEKKRAAKAAAEGQEATAVAPDHDNHAEMEAEAVTSLQLDEASWALDDAQSEVAAEQQLSITAAGTRPAKLADEFIARHPVPPSHSVPLHPLSLPVILTQRRPKTRNRGFILAYSPVLEAARIDQPTFLDFLSRLNKAVEPNPWIQAINLAGFVGQAVPEPFFLLVSLAAKLVADAAGEIHSRGKTNLFLDRVNQNYFKPRGLIALVMTWKPETTSRLTDVYMDNGVQSAVSAAASGSSQGTFSRVTNRLKASSAESSFQWPETAPLVFPALDELAERSNPPAAAVDDDSATTPKKPNSFKRYGKFVDDYLDRRALAKWAGQAPDSNIANAVPKPTFRSRYADPNHPASSGDIVALLTGGAYQMPTRGPGLGMERTGSWPGGFGLGRGGGFDGRGGGGGGGVPALGGLANAIGSRLVGSGQDARSQGEGDGQDGAQARPGFGRGLGQGRGFGVGRANIGEPTGLVGGFANKAPQDVLYLMIVNLPSEEELATAAVRLAAEH
ncbi:hypothetical protein C8A01DRAFT_12657 [Parachaetomium inaequale]|uniref:Uncharacterized protein n=1 Tax=Parachaetomium inaequale TaxID=2588326 RepID=A0AAN6PN79_9PEZI|nr:hypothetical protein C8A01DRAFT_12657 [Parachaetomium inaequale]